MPQAPSVHPSFNLMGALFSGTATVAAGLFTTLVVLFYLLVSGETFLRRFVEILPSFAEKRQAVEITLDIERNISAYLITVTLINFIVGVLTFAIMWVCGVANPLLWGVIAFVVNFVPILGPMVGIAIFLMASVLSLGVTWWALLPVGLYFLVHVIEGETGHADADGASLHHQSRRRDPGADLLVLDVGRARRHSRGADAGDHQIVCDELLPAARVRAFFGGVSGSAGEEAQEPVEHLVGRFLVHIVAAGQRLAAYVFGALPPECERIGEPLSHAAGLAP